VSGFSRANKGLKDTFPLSGLELHEPGQLFESVQLTHPMFGPLIRIGSGERRREVVVGGVGVTEVVVSQAPLERVRLVEFADVSHNDAAALAMEFNIRIFGAASVTVQNSRFVGPGTTAAAFVRMGLERPILLGPGDQLVALVVVGGAGSITAACVFTDYTLADNAPFY
jgi:hypothetical protein